MIELTYNALLMIYLAVTLLTVLGVWVYSHMTSRRRKFYSSEKEIRVCEYCQLVYLDEAAKSLTRCPQCHLFSRNKEN